MNSLSDRVRDDFDLIADLPDEGWNHNRQYHDWILDILPDRLGNVLEVGCGKGDFCRRLASRAQHVTGIDFSPRMIDRAREESRELSNVEFVLGDFQTWAGPTQPVDVIVSIATLHHLDPMIFARRANSFLRPGGLLVIVDLRRDASVFDRLMSLVAVIASLFKRWRKSARLRPSAESRAVWDRHAEIDHYLSFHEAESIWRELLPGSIVRRHLFWRYSVTWRKPLE